MLLHLFDDEKVVNRTVENFEKVFPDNNLFICFIKDQPRIVKPHLNLYFYQYGSMFDSKILKDVDKVIIHFLSYPKIVFIEKYIPKTIPCYWVIWGGDLYNGFLKNKGYELYYKTAYLTLATPTLNLRQYLFNLIKKPYIEKRLLTFIKKRVTHFVTNTDFEIAKKYIGEYIKGVQVKGFRYYPIDIILGDLIDSKVSGNIIWIGNSASFTNNHLYAFDFLSRLNIEGKKIITPLSYGGSMEYRNYVNKKGLELWGEQYESLMNFLSLSEYNKLMLSAEVAIFPSWRQEAFGNIVVALYLGSKVFLSERSSLVKYFQEIGVKVFLLEEMTQKELDTPLSDSVKKRNREMIYSVLNQEVILDSIKRIWG